MTSSEWTRYFQENANSLLTIPWESGAELTPEETEAISSSLQTFQAGESSEGHHLFRYAKEYADRSGDHAYVPAIRLFIAEEQRHARDLGRFLQLNGIPLVRTTFTDVVFRKLRNLLGGLEMSIAVLVTAEIIAKVYYAALQEATGSHILRRLCEQILRDELKHVEFQTEQLRVLRRHRGKIASSVIMAAQRFLFFGAVIVVGIFHRRALARGGYPFARWWKQCWAEFDHAYCQTKSAREVVAEVSGIVADAAK